MSLSTPNSSRTLAILSGAAITVSPRLSGFTLGMSVIKSALGDGGARLNFRDLRRQGKERHEAPCQIDVAL